MKIALVQDCKNRTLCCLCDPNRRSGEAVSGWHWQL